MTLSRRLLVCIGDRNGHELTGHRWPALVSPAGSPPRQAGQDSATSSLLQKPGPSHSQEAASGEAQHCHVHPERALQEHRGFLAKC